MSRLALATALVPLLTGCLHSVHAGHFTYHYYGGDAPNLESLEAMEAHYAWFSETFHVPMPEVVHATKYPAESAAALLGHHSGVTPSESVYSRFESRQWFHPHEAVHVYMLSRSPFLDEGLAGAFGTTFTDSWTLAPKRELIRYESVAEALPMHSDFHHRNEDLHYALARYLVRWLYLRFGTDKILQLVGEVRESPAHVERAFQRVYGADLQHLVEQAAGDFDWLRRQKPPRGFFLYPIVDMESATGKRLHASWRQVADGTLPIDNRGEVRKPRARGSPDAGPEPAPVLADGGTEEQPSELNGPDAGVGTEPGDGGADNSADGGAQ